ncbi:MAG: hypothetical protein KAS39_07250 [Actinomycetia bacterium]|nr:hypothetical protein [Actinomycetes bacterium]
MERDELDENLNFIKDAKKELKKRYKGKYILVSKKRVIDSFDTFEQASEEGNSKYGSNGTFLIYSLISTRETMH